MSLRSSRLGESHSFRLATTEAVKALPGNLFVMPAQAGIQRNLDFGELSPNEFVRLVTL